MGKDKIILWEKVKLFYGKRKKIFMGKDKIILWEKIKLFYGKR